MANPVWDGLVTYVTWTASQASTSFNVAAGTGAITFILPDLATDTTANLQGLDPIDKTTWRNVEALDVTAGSGASDPIVLTESKYIVVPASAIGLGTFRLNAPTTAQTGTATILIDRI
jgi:hypothetical protein